MSKYIIQNVDRSISLGEVDIDARVYKKSGEGYMEFSVDGTHIGWGRLSLQSLSELERWIAKLKHDFVEHTVIKNRLNQ
ncbi:MAG: hypothetical protein WC503_04175 [Candidatus Shapirobacteria bacterium]